MGPSKQLIFCLLYVSYQYSVNDARPVNDDRPQPVKVHHLEEHAAVRHVKHTTTQYTAAHAHKKEVTTTQPQATPQVAISFSPGHAEPAKKQGAATQPVAASTIPDTSGPASKQGAATPPVAVSFSPGHVEPARKQRQSAPPVAVSFSPGHVEPATKQRQSTPQVAISFSPGHAEPATKEGAATPPVGVSVSPGATESAAPEPVSTPQVGVSISPGITVSSKAKSAAASGVGVGVKVTNRTTGAKGNETEEEERPCPEWYDGEVQGEIKLLLLNDERIFGAPHLLMTPASFSSPSYFQKPCTIGSGESEATTIEKCGAQLDAVKSLKDRISKTIGKAEESGDSVNSSLRQEFSRSLYVTNEPWKSFVNCHCTNCSQTLTEIPDEMFWRDTWSMVGVDGFEPGTNLCPSSQQTHGEEPSEHIALDDLFRMVWNTETGKVQDRHQTEVHNKRLSATQQTEAGESEKRAGNGEPTGEQKVNENGNGGGDASSSMMFGFHPMVIVLQIAATTAAVTASFFMFYR